MSSPPPDRRQRALPYVFFAVVLLGVFAPVFFAGRVLGGHHDRADQMIPFYTAFSRAFHKRHIPQWNPYVFCGKSMAGSGMFVFFYPLYWLVFALPESTILRSTTFVLIFHVALTLVGSFQLFRRLGADRFWATLAAFTYVFSASSTLQMATELNFTSFVYPPILLWLIAGQTRGKLVANAVAQTAFFALLLVSSNVQLVMYTVALCLGYAGYRALVRDDGEGSVRPWQLDWRRLVATCSAFVVACFISCARWVPFVFANRAEPSSKVSYADFLLTTRVTWSDFLRFLMPQFFGTDGYANFFGHINHFESVGGYVGVVGGAVTVYALLFRWNRRTAFWSGWLVFTVLLVLGTPLTWLHYVATGRTMLHFTRFAWLAPLPCAALRALEGPAFFGAIRRRTWLFVTAFGLGVLAAGLYAYEHVLLDGQKRIMGEQAKEAIGLFAVLAVTLFLLLYVAKRFGESSRVFRAALLGVSVLDLFVTFADEANITRPFFEPLADFAYPEEDHAVARAASEPWRRFRVYREPVMRNVKIYSHYTVNDRWIQLGAYSSSGYDNGSPQRIVKLVLAPTEASSTSRIFERVIWPVDGRTAELLSTAYVIRAKSTALAFAHPVPRAGLYQRYRVLDDDAALKAVYEPTLDLTGELVLDRAPSFASRDLDSGPVAGDVTITDDDFDSVTLHAKADRVSLVFLDDTFADGWSVTVDGQPAAPIRANYAFRAVEIPAGEHDVRWTFVQRGLDTGLRCSVFGLGIFFVGLGYVVVTSRRARGASVATA